MSLEWLRQPTGGLLLAFAVWAGVSTPSLEAQLPAMEFQKVPQDVLIGETFQFKMLFRADPALTGYGPFVELYLDQGANCTPGPCDGLEFAQAEAVFANGNVALPQPALFTGVPPVPPLPGFQKIVLELPFGSFVPSQPPVEIEAAVRVHRFADVNAPLRIKARGGFRYGGSVSGATTIGGFVDTAVTPHVFTLRKSYLGPESETATGPNFPRKYRLEVDIAGGQLVDNLTIGDCLPENLQLLGVDLANTTPTPGPPVTLPDNCFEVPFGFIRGGPNGPDAVASFDVFVPETDTSGEPVLGVSCTATSVDQATASGIWIPEDPRDRQTFDAVSSSHTLTDKCIALQKRVEIAVDNGQAGPTPGDVLKYTLELQVSDFKTIGNLVMEDYLSDGQTLLNSPRPPSLEIHDRFGNLSVPNVAFTQFNVPTAPCQTASPVARPSRLRFRVSSVLAQLSTQPRHLLGILTGGHASLPAGSATTVTLTFFARIDDRYQRQSATLEPFVDQGDPLLNCAIARAQVLENADEPAIPSVPGPAASDTSATRLEIVRSRLQKSIYAINGATSFPAAEVRPGDTVTFRIRYPLSSGDVEKLKLVDFNPLPVLPVQPGAFQFVQCGSSTLPSPPPPVNSAWSIGPFCQTVPSFLAAGPGAPNSLTFDYGTLSSTANQGSEVDLLYTVQATTAPLPDGLQLSNEVYEQESNTFGAPSAQAALARFKLCEPKLRIRTGVVSTDHQGARFDPTPAAPSGVQFAPPGAPGPAFTGTITSANIGADTLRSDLFGADGCDLVKYAIVIENLGCSPAFDVQLQDIIQPCLSGYSNFQVRNGKGRELRCDGGQSCTPLLPFFLTPGLALDDSSGSGALAPYSANGGDNLAIITFDARLGCGIGATGCCTTLAKLHKYAGAEKGPNHVPAGLSTPFFRALSPSLDDAKVCVQQTLLKSIVATSEPHTARFGGIEQLAVGEVVTYRLDVTVPEGVSPNMVVSDTLPAGLQWLAGSCTVDKSPSIATAKPVNVVLSGASLRLDLGHVTNYTNTLAAERLAVTCRALVLNEPANRKPAAKDNSFSVQLKAQGEPVVVSSSNTVQGLIVEPSVVLTQKEVPSASQDRVTYEIEWANTGTATAFDVTLFDPLPAPLTVSGVQLSGTASCSVAPTPSNQVKITCATLPVGASLKVRIEAAGFPLCREMVNGARLDVSSLPGPRGTGSATPGESGTATGERIFSTIASVSANRCPDLVLTKGHLTDLPLGQDGTYTFTVRNTGNTPSLPQDLVQDTLPVGLLFLSGGGDGWSCGSADGRDVTCAGSTPLPPGGSSSFPMTVAVSCGTPAAVENCATVSTTAETDLSDNRSCTPAKVTRVDGVIVALAAGGYHSLALRSDGTVFVWGDQGTGPFQTNPVPFPVPSPLPGLAQVDKIASGGAHSLALRKDGTVWSWGSNDFGQLGNGTLTSSGTPLQVTGLTNIVAIAAGGYHSLALKSDGTLWVWGRNDFGQLGIGSAPGARVPLPTQVGVLTGVTALAAGLDHSLAVRSDGAVWAWGKNDFGKLGSGSTALFSPTPVQVKGAAGTGSLTGIVSVSAGLDHSLALGADGTVWGWGNNAFGKLGNGTAAGSRVPVQASLPPGGGFVALAAGRHHSLALRNDGTLWGWGGNTFGQLGFGIKASGTNLPLPLTGPIGIAAIAVGSTHSLALPGNGATVRAWGSNDWGQLGNGTTASSAMPVRAAILATGCAAPPRSMTAWWPFDEAAGLSAEDLAGTTRNNGSSQPSQRPTPRPGKVSYGLCFDGTDDRVEVADDPELDLDTGDFTIDAWIQTTAATSFRTIIDKREGSYWGYAFFLSNGQLVLQMATGLHKNFYIAGSPSVADGQWHHVAVTVDRDNPKGGIFYIDGRPVLGTFNPMPYSSSLGNGASARIGARPQALGGEFYFQGCLDELEVFKRALSAEEIKAIYDAGSAGKCKC